MLSMAAALAVPLNPSAAGTAPAASNAAAAPTAANPAAATTADVPITVFESLLLPAATAAAGESAAPAADSALDEDPEPAAASEAESGVDERSAQGQAVNLLLQWLRPAPAPTPTPTLPVAPAPAPESAPGVATEAALTDTVAAALPEWLAPLPPTSTAAALAQAAVAAPPPLAQVAKPAPARGAEIAAVAEPVAEPLILPSLTAADPGALSEVLALLAAPTASAATETPMAMAPNIIEGATRAMATPAAPASPPPQTLHTDQPDWTLALGESIAWSLDHQQPEALIELHPAELGSLVVRIETRGADAQVTIVAATAAARDLLQQSLPQLRELLMVQGLNLSRAQIDRPSAAGQGAQSDLQSFRERGSAGAGGRRRVGRLLLVDAYA